MREEGGGKLVGEEGKKHQHREEGWRNGKRGEQLDQRATEIETGEAGREKERERRERGGFVCDLAEAAPLLLVVVVVVVVCVCVFVSVCV